MTSLQSRLVPMVLAALGAVEIFWHFIVHVWPVMRLRVCL